MTGAQCKMARVGLGWGVRDLAEAARVSTNTVTRLERGDALHERTIISIRHALEAGGAIFLDPEPNTGPGVRLRDSGT
ncbi:MAG: transcriptional regulator [Alphaproteobacteria bacterium]|nr:transcriptional regulator [Alphaproteobacteria bacterium]